MERYVPLARRGPTVTVLLAGSTLFAGLTAPSAVQRTRCPPTRGNPHGRFEFCPGNPRFGPVEDPVEALLTRGAASGAARHVTVRGTQQDTTHRYKALALCSICL